MNKETQFDWDRLRPAHDYAKKLLESGISLNVSVEVAARTHGLYIDETNEILEALRNG